MDKAVLSISLENVVTIWIIVFVGWAAAGLLAQLIGRQRMAGP